MPAVPATEKQLAFLAKLRSERPSQPIPELPTIGGSLTKAAASAEIDRLLSIPKDAAPAKAAAADVAPEGFHQTPAGEYVKVVTSKTGQRYGKNLIVHSPAVKAEDGSFLYPAEVEWVYGGKSALQGLSEATLLSSEAAKGFGLLYGRCINCKAVLSREESLHVGYGPTCASNHGWWYPTSAEFKLLLAAKPASNGAPFPTQDVVDFGVPEALDLREAGYHLMAPAQA